MSTLKELLMGEAKERDAAAAGPTISFQNSGNTYSNGPVVQNHPTPYAPAYTPVSEPAKVQPAKAEPTVHALSRDGFAMDEELSAKYGSYENYLDDVVTDQYYDRVKQTADTQLAWIGYDPQRDSVNAARDELKTLTSVSAAAGNLGMTTDEYQTFQKQKYGVEELGKSLEAAAAPVTSAKDALTKLQAEIDYLGKPNYGAGNIDLSATPRFDNGDGTYSTVDSMSFHDDQTGLEILIPTVVQIDGEWRHVNADQAIEEYRKTGKYLGAFNTVEEANTYANQLHDQQEQLFSRRAELSAQYQAAADLYGNAYSAYQNGPYRQYVEAADAFQKEYEPVQYYLDRGQTLTDVDNVIAGLEATMQNAPAGSPEYNAAKRRLDALKTGRMLFATDDELKEMYATTPEEHQPERAPVYLSAGVAAMPNAPAANEGLSDAAKTRLAAGQEIERRDALRVMEQAKDTAAGVFLDGLAEYAATGEISDDLVKLFGLEWDSGAADIPPSDASIMSAIGTATRRALKEQGFTDQEAANTVDALTRAGNAIYTKKDTDMLRKLTSENAAGMAALSVLSNTVSGLGMVEGLRAAFSGSTNRTADPNSLWMSNLNDTNAIRGEIMETHNKPVEFLGQTFDAYDAGFGVVMSSLDSAMSMLFPGKVGGALIGTEAAAQSLLESAEKGMPIGESLLTSVVAGVNEGLWEAATIGSLKALKDNPVVTFGDVVKNLTKQGLVNGSEEFNTELANVIFDYLKDTSFSDYNREIGELMTQINPKTGQAYTKEQARNRVMIDDALRCVGSGATGFIQGVLMGSFAQTAALANAKMTERATLKKLDATDTLTNAYLGASFAPDSQTYALATQALKEYEQITAAGADNAQKETMLEEWAAKYGPGSETSLSQVMAAEFAKAAPEGFTEGVHQAILDAVERGDETPVHIETPTEAKIREAQTAAGMSQAVADETRALLLDVMAGKTDLKFSGISDNTLTGMPFRAIVERMTGAKLLGASAADVKRALKDIAAGIADRSVDVGKTGEVMTEQTDLVQPVQAPSSRDALMFDVFKRMRDGGAPAQAEAAPAAEDVAAPAQTGANDRDAMLGRVLNQMRGQPLESAHSTAEEIEEAPAARPARPVRDTSVGAAKIGFASDQGQSFEDWMQGAKDVHPISDEQKNNDQYNRAGRDAVQYRRSIGEKVLSRAAQTIRNSGMTPDSMAATIDQAVANGAFTHIPYADKAALADVDAAIERDGWDDVRKAYKDAVDRGEASKKLTATGIALYNYAASAGDGYAAMEIMDLMIRNASNSAAALQAQRMLNKLGPDARLYMAVRGIENIAESVRQKYPKAKDVKLDPQLLNQYRDALVSGDKAAQKEAMTAIEQNIADQLPADWREKLNNWRYLSMLLNPTTHARNFFSNAGFAVPRLMKQAVKAGLERAVMGKAGEGSSRTTAVLNNFSAADRARYAAARDDYKNVVDIIQSGGKMTEGHNAIEDKRTIYNTKLLEKLRKGNMELLDKGDVLFSRPAYAEALASYLKARGIDGDDYANGNLTDEAKAAAQTHAILEAQKATYRDRNQFSDAIAALGSKGRSRDAKAIPKFGHLVTEAVLPFKRTPANILARAVEYSPAEFVNVLFGDVSNIVKAQRKTKDLEAKSDGSDVALREIAASKEAEAGEVSAMLDHIASGLTGSALIAVGAMLRHFGWLNGGEDDGTDDGTQKYSINVGDYSYTLDWLAPEALPVFMGVALYDKLIDRDEADGWNVIDDVKNALQSIYEPALNMTMLENVNDIIRDAKGVPALEILPKLLKNAAYDLAGQFFPTVFGKVENIVEPYARTTFVDKNSPLGKDEQYFLAGIANKSLGIPGVEYNQVTEYDAWGRPKEKGDLLQRVVQNMLSPGKMQAKTTTPYDDELKRLTNAGYSVMPSTTAFSTKVDSENLTAQEWELYARTRGQTQYDLVGELLGSSGYDKLSDSEKAKAITDIYTLAKQTAANAVREARNGVTVDTAPEKAGMDAAGYLIANTAYNGAETPEGTNATDAGNTPEWAKMLAVLNDDTISEAERLQFVNARSNRKTDFSSYSEAKTYYTAKGIYDNATTPAGYKTTDAGNTPGWAKALAVINDSSLSNSEKLWYINEVSGRKSDFQTLSEARDYYTDKKEKAKK